MGDGIDKHTTTYTSGKCCDLIGIGQRGLEENTNTRIEWEVLRAIIPTIQSMALLSMDSV
jgi:hypothetical protein